MDPVIIPVVSIIAIVIITPLIIKMARYHKCKDFGEVKDGIQHCTVCNKAISISAPKCNHPEWETIKDVAITRPYSGLTTDPTIGHIYTLRCKVCGDIKTYQHTL